MKLSRTLLLSLQVTVLWLVSFAVMAKVPAGIAVTVSPVKQSYSASDSLLLSVRYTNVTAQDITFLKWGTAIEGRVDGDFLDINGALGLLPYVGREYKRAAPTPADYITVKSNGVVEKVVDVSEGYALGVQGSYQVWYKANQLQSLALKSNAVAVLELSEDRPIFAFKRTPTTESCVGSRPSQIDSAVGAAESIARTGRDSLQNTPVGLRSSARRYKEWFGTYSVGRWNTVQSHFNLIFSALSSRVLNFICDDTSTAFAYVFPSQPYNIYLGQSFWSAPTNGTDSKAGTIIHELSHFNVLGGTDDIFGGTPVYGQSAARAQARSFPDRSVRHADSHEYFAENTPNLPMPTAADLVIDLVVASSTFSNLEPAVDEPITISGAIANQGNGASSVTSLSLNVLAAESEVPVVTQIAIPAIAPGTSYNFQLDFVAPSESGEYTAQLCVSPVSGESNTGNNCAVPLQKIIVKGDVVTIVPILMLLLDD